MRGFYSHLLVAGLVSGAAACHLAELDPAALVAERTPVGAVACGASSGWSDAPPEPVRACALDAIARGDAFHAIADAAVFDGRLTVGYASDGARFLKLDYAASYGMFPGTDTEEVRWTVCAGLEPDRADCPTLTRDLCLRCAGATPLP